jgi:hypothetical protein
VTGAARLVSILILVVLPASAGAQTPAGKAVVERDVVDLAPAAGQTITALRVDNRLGDVRIEGHDRPGVTVLAIKRAPDDETLDRIKVSLVPDPRGPVHIDTALVVGPETRPIAAGSVRVDLVLRVPRTAAVTATVWNGTIGLFAMDNGAELTSNEGDIEVVGCAGDLVTHTAQGSQRIQEVFGEVAAEGVTGAMRLEVVRGRRLDARLYDGPILARQVASQEVNLRTIRGDIHFEGELPAGGSWLIASRHGDVFVSFREGTAFRVEAVARAGRVELPPRLAVERRGESGPVIGTYGGGRRPAGLSLQSRFGDVKLELLEAR